MLNYQRVVHERYRLLVSDMNFIFHFIDVILPIDELIFFKLVKSPPTRIIMIYLSIVRFTHQKWCSIAMLVYQRIIMKVPRALGDFLKEKNQPSHWALEFRSRNGCTLKEWAEAQSMQPSTVGFPGSLCPWNTATINRAWVKWSMIW